MLERPNLIGTALQQLITSKSCALSKRTPPERRSVYLYKYRQQEHISLTLRGSLMNIPLEDTFKRKTYNRRSHRGPKDRNFLLVVLRSKNSSNEKYTQEIPL